MKRASKFTAFGSVGLVLLTLLLALSTCITPQNGWPTPLEGLDPFCLYNNRVLQEVTVVFAGETLKSEVVIQRGLSRPWISTMNSSGCGSKFGNTHVFRTRMGNVLLIPSMYCGRRDGKIPSKTAIDVGRQCYSTPRRFVRPVGYIVYSADYPVNWQRIDLNNENIIVVKSVTEQKTWIGPRDNIDALAPALLHTDFSGRGSLPSGTLMLRQGKERKFIARRSQDSSVLSDDNDDPFYCTSGRTGRRCIRRYGPMAVPSGPQP